MMVIVFLNPFVPQLVDTVEYTTVFIGYGCLIFIVKS